MEKVIWQSRVTAEMIKTAELTLHEQEGMLMELDEAMKEVLTSYGIQS